MRPLLRFLLLNTGRMRCRVFFLLPLHLRVLFFLFLFLFLVAAGIALHLQLSEEPQESRILVRVDLSNVVELYATNDVS